MTELSQPERESDRQALVYESDSDDSDYNQPISNTRPVQWWCLEPAVRRNWCVVVGAYLLLFLGTSSFMTGIILEFVNLHSRDIIIRGIIFIGVGVVLLIPSLYAIVHIYLAAKRIGRVRLSSVWFFR